MNKSAKKFFTVTVIDEMFGQFSGEFFVRSEKKAEKEARTWYAFELGTFPENIEVLTVREGRLHV